MGANSQLIEIDLDGAMTTIMRKRGVGFDINTVPGAFETLSVVDVSTNNTVDIPSIRKVRRVSLIEFCETRQAFYIMPVIGIHKNRWLTVSSLASVGVSLEAVSAICNKVQLADDGAILIGDYEDAVAVEVMYMDALGFSD